MPNNQINQKSDGFLSNEDILKKFEYMEFAMEHHFTRNDMMQAFELVRKDERARMTDEEMTKHWGKLPRNERFSSMMTNILRQAPTSEDLKSLGLQWIKEGVKVWVSWSDVHAYSQPEISVNRPTEIDGLGGKAYSNYNVADACVCPDLIAQLLGVEPGQCKPFLITEVQDVSI